MSVQVENLEKSMAKLTIEVSAEQFEAAMQKAYIKNKGRIQLPGFRKGKAPRAMIEKMYGAGVFYEEAANDLIPEAYANAAAESELEIVARPEISVTQIEKGKPFVFEAEVTLKPEVKLGEYKGIKVEKADTKVTAKEVNAELDKIKEQFDDNFKTVLFIGGSAGAKVFNDFISNTPQLTEKYNVINISGDSSLNTLERHLYRVDYVTDLYQPLMDTADLVVTRGGSNTIFELLAMKKLHLIIPLGKEASRGDQLENAAYFERKGYARQLQETELSWETLNHELEQLVEHAETYKEAMAKSEEITSPDDFYNLLVTSISKK